MLSITELYRITKNWCNQSNRVKDEQLQVVTNVVSGKDVFAVLPTGYGKSLCFALLPGVFNRLMGVPMSIVVVLSPLIAIMKDQVRLKVLTHCMGRTGMARSHFLC